MRRTITLSLAVFMTPVVIMLSGPDAKAQHGPGYTACTVKWAEAGRPDGWNEFMSNCLRSVQLVPEKQTPPLQPQGGTQGGAVSATPPAVNVATAAWIRQQTASPKPRQRTTTPQRPAQSGQTDVNNETGYEKLVRIYGKDAVEAAYLAYPWISQDDQRMAQLQGGTH